MKCWRCGAVYEVGTNNKIAFGMVCEKCFAALHSCVNCKHYHPGLPNDCNVPGTEPVSDREAANYCDEFSLKEAKIADSKKVDPREISRSLFKEEFGGEEPPEDRFKSLFKK